MEGIYARHSPVLGRAVQLGIAAERVVGVSFPESPPADADPDHPLLDRVFAYLDGAEDDLADVTVALTVPTDQRTVLEAARAIPYGETVDVARLARVAGMDDEDEGVLETVRTALRENPVPLFVPDHRIAGPGATPVAVAERLRELEGTAR
jgi:methylated-DNA-[protein]-cysteine S-methyltransferase